MTLVARRPVPTSASVRVFGLCATPEGITPTLPDLLLDLFLRELSHEPHENLLVCNVCGATRRISAFNGQTCTERNAGHFCGGTIQYRWSRTSAYARFLEVLTKGGVALAQTVEASPMPVGLCLCEPHGPDTVVNAVDMPMNVLSQIYARFDREGPYLVVPHLAIELDSPQLFEVFGDLIRKAVESVMVRERLARGNVLIVVDARESELRHMLLRRMLGTSYGVVASDSMGGRHRALVAGSFAARS